MAPACSNETLLPGFAEEEEGKLKENNPLNEQLAAALHPLATQLSTRLPDAHILKMPNPHINNSQFICYRIISRITRSLITKNAKNAKWRNH